MAGIVTPFRRLNVTLDATATNSTIFRGKGKIEAADGSHQGR